MIKPIQFIKDVIYILRNPPGEAKSALKLTAENIDEIKQIPELDPRLVPYLKEDHFVIEYENMLTVIPDGEFHEHYAFTGPAGEDGFRPVILIKPL